MQIIQNNHDRKDQYIPYFGYSELACRATNKLILAKGFADKLLALRIKWDNSMIITSCCRSKEHNRQIGGNPRSFHIYDHPHYTTNGTCAIDIAVSEGAARGRLIHLAWSLGWSIGINKRFIHLDRRTDYTNLKQTLFLY